MRAPLGMVVEWRVGSVFALAVAALFVLPTVGRASTHAITARAAVIMDAVTGEVLWERNGDEPLPPASTTKVLTAILALESGRLDQVFTVSPLAAETAPSKINLQPGQRLRLRHLLYALLLNSANDAAVVIAEGLAGSEEAFATRMNAKARAVGATSTHFVNPHGLSAPGHVSTARDLARLFRHGLHLPFFRDILATRRISVPVEANRTHMVALRSHNRLLVGYDYPVIGKTGYTRPAGRCFVGAAEHDGREVIVAVLGATDLWGDARRLIEQGLGTAADRDSVIVATKRTRPAHSTPQVSEGDAAVESSQEFAVQIGPYKTRRAAMMERQRLARRGYRPSLADRTLRLGSFAERTDAATLAAKLKQSGYRPTIVALP